MTKLLTPEEYNNRKWDRHYGRDYDAIPLPVICPKCQSPMNFGSIGGEISPQMQKVECSSCDCVEEVIFRI